MKVVPENPKMSGSAPIVAWRHPLLWRPAPRWPPAMDIRWPGRQRASENRDMEHLSRQRLEAGLGQILDSPRDDGQIVLVVRRPAVGAREMPQEVMLDAVAGLAGDNWLARGSRGTPDGSA